MHNIAEGDRRILFWHIIMNLICIKLTYQAKDNQQELSGQATLLCLGRGRITWDLYDGPILGFSF